MVRTHCFSERIFLWKTKQILIASGLSLNDESLQQFANKISILTDKDTPSVSDFGDILQALPDSHDNPSSSKI